MRVYFLLIFIISGIIFICRLLVKYYESKPNQFDEAMDRQAFDAVSLAKKEYETDLTYDRSSTKDLELILELLYKKHQENSISNPEIIFHSRIWGAYLGAVIKRIRPAHWRKNSKKSGEGSMPLIFENNSEIFPCLWIYRRIKFGDQDNVEQKVMAIVSN